MPFYQNVFDTDFSDTQWGMTFKVRNGLPNSSQLLVAWNTAPFNLSSAANLTINYSFDSGNSWTPLVVDVSSGAASSSAVTATEVVAALTANATFVALFQASVLDDGRGNMTGVKIRSLRSRLGFKVYISNSGAETMLGFNKRAGVAELPTYFSRHTIENKGTYENSCGLLIELDVEDAVDQAIITTAGLDYSSPKEDWELLRGQSKTFTFKKITVDDSNRITDIIEYQSGAVEGDLGKLTQYAYTGANTSPSQVTEIPHVLTEDDLITPTSGEFEEEEGA